MSKKQSIGIDVPVVVILLLIVFALASCKSPVKSIADNANKISTLAQSSKERFERIEEAAKTELIDVQSVQKEAKAGVQEQEKIIATTKITIVDLTKVQDIVPWWGTMINYIFIGLSILGVLAILWYLGVGNLTRNFFYSLGMFVPKKKVEEAKLVRKTLASDDPVTTRELVAALRASDPAFDAAYKKTKE
jgi:ABC-type multidrug transport system fused ATPase/permease subunit